MHRWQSMLLKFFLFDMGLGITAAVTILLGAVVWAAIGVPTPALIVLGIVSIGAMMSAIVIGILATRRIAASSW